ncbi:MAG TPA: hypothetical protein VMV80_06605 [Anaerolineales bacterium]|nr:hypothetical protein [Anaerolineales bacterium]
MVKIKFDPPGKEEPGFLRRAKRALGFQQRFKEDASPELIDDLVSFLADYVTEPKDRTEAMDALLDASENQFMELLGSLSGEGEEVPKSKSSEPETGSKLE